MIIKDFIVLAKFGELAGVALKNNTEAIVASINLGMTELYGRFPIKIEEYVISLIAGTSTYEMPSNFIQATDAYMEVDKDSDERFSRIGINDEDDEFSIYFNDWNTVQVPAALTGSYISVIYMAKPAGITVDQAEDGTTELDLPDSLVDCLLSYVGHRGHLGVKSDSQSETNTHWARFERNCAKARELGIAFPADTMSMNERINDRGFV